MGTEILLKVSSWYFALMDSNVKVAWIKLAMALASAFLSRGGTRISASPYSSISGIPSTAVPRVARRTAKFNPLTAPERAGERLIFPRLGPSPIYKVSGRPLIKKLGSIEASSE